VQDRKRKYNAILWSVRVKIVAMETQQYITFIVAGVDVAINNINVISVAMEMEQWVPFALLVSYEIFRTIVNINNPLNIISVSVILP
jgi:hypothetical protein